MAQFQFNAATVAPSTGNDPIPAGWYNAKITESKIEPTSDGQGLRMNLMFEVIGGKMNGRKVFTGLNIKNASAQAQEIAYKDLSAICHAVNQIEMQQTEQLHGKPLKIKVKVKPASKNTLTGEEYEARNEITTYKDVNSAVKMADEDGPAIQAAPSGFSGMVAPAMAAPAGFAQPQAPAAQAQQAAQATWAQPPAQQPWAGTQVAAEPAQVQTPPPGFAQMQQQAPAQVAPMAAPVAQASTLTPEVMAALQTGQTVALSPQQLQELQAMAQAQQAAQAQAQAHAQLQAQQAAQVQAQALAQQAAQVQVQVPGVAVQQPAVQAQQAAAPAIDPAIASAVPPWAQAAPAQ